MTKQDKARKPNGNAPTGIMSAIAAAQAQHEAEQAGKHLTLAEKATAFLRECRESLTETTRTRVSPLIRTLASSPVAVSGRVSRGRAFAKASAKWADGVLRDVTINVSRMDKTAAECITAVVKPIQGEETVTHYQMSYDIAPNAEIGSVFHHLSETGVRLSDCRVKSVVFEVFPHIDENGRQVIQTEELGAIIAAGRAPREYARLRGF
jgi:hypothetical protein